MIGRVLVAEFDGGALISDAGGLLLGAGRAPGPGAVVVASASSWSLSLVSLFMGVGIPPKEFAVGYQRFISRDIW
jgi:hypothetical protein